MNKHHGNRVASGMQAARAHPHRRTSALLRLLLLCAGCAGDRAPWQKPRFCTVEPNRIETILAGMSLAQKAGQVLMVGGGGSAAGPDDETRRVIAELHVGGLFLPPLSGVQLRPSDTAALIRKTQELSVSTSEIPLFVSLDQEGGHAAVLNTVSGGTDTPGNLALGQAREPRYTFDSYDIMGAEIHALGFNMDFAPVLDITPDPANGAENTRGFSSNPQLVADLSSAAVWGLQNNRVLGTVKHAPGTGLTGLDTHKELPVVDIGREAFFRTTLLPFARAVREGTDGMMTGHIIYPAIDPDYPASMSEAFVRGVVRRDLRFEGLIITDSIGMAGATRGAGAEGPTVRALRAGNDMVLSAGSGYQGAADKVSEILTAAEDGRLAEADLNAAVRRILFFKMKYCAFESPFPGTDAITDRVGTQENASRAQRAADATIAIFRKEPGVLPLTAQQKVLFVGPSRFYEDAGSGWSNFVDRTMGDVLGGFTTRLLRYEVTLPPNPAEAGNYLPFVSEADVVVVATINAHYSRDQREFLAPLFSAGKPVILLTLGVPYDAWDFPQAGTVLNVTGQRSVSLTAAAKVLFGKIEAQGRPAVNMEQAP